MGVKGGTTSNTGNQFAAGTSAAQMSGNKATTTNENTNQNINTNNTGTTTNYGYNNQNTAQNQYGGNNTSNTTAGTAASQQQAANIIAAQNALFGRHAPTLGALDINSYLNPYASYALQGLNQNLGIGDKRLASSNIAQSGGVGGDRRAVSEALNFGQDQLARGQLMSQIYGQAVPIAQQQQGAQYGANQFAYNAPWTQTGQMAGNLAQLQQTLGQTQAGTGTNYNFGNTAVAGTSGNVGTSQNIGSQTADTTKNLTSDVNTNTSQTGSNQGFQVGSNEQTSTMSPFQVGAGLLTSALAFAPSARGGRISHKSDGGGVDDDMPAPPSLPQIHFANLFAGLPKAGEANKVPDLSGIKPHDSAPYGGGSPLGALFGQSAKGGSSDNPLPGLSADDYGAGYASGGSTPYGVRGYQTDGRVIDDQGNVIDPRDVTDDTGTINAGHPMRFGLLHQPSGQSDASSDGVLNYAAASGPYTGGAPAADTTTRPSAPHPESYAEWRQRQSADSDMTDRYKLPFGLNANKFLLRAGLGILGAGSGSTSNPVTALGKGFTGALDSQQKDEQAQRELYNQYLTDEQKERFHQDTVEDREENRKLRQLSQQQQNAYQRESLEDRRQHGIEAIEQRREAVRAKHIANEYEIHTRATANAAAILKDDRNYIALEGDEREAYRDRVVEAEKAKLRRSAAAAQDGGQPQPVQPPAAPRTIIDTGVVNSGPNKGKRAIKYSDGTVEYQ